MRKLTLLAIAAVLMLAQSSPAFSSTFSGPYACRASGIPTLVVFSDSAPVMTLSANAGGTFSSGTLLFFRGGDTCQYSLDTTSTQSNFTLISGSTGQAVLSWIRSASSAGTCTNSILDPFAFVLSGLPSSNASANTVQITDVFGPSYECTQK